MIVYLIIGKNIDWKNFSFIEPSLKVGIDKGSFLALENGIKLDYAIGDFDSCSEEEKAKILAEVPCVIKLNPIKDDTDTKHAYSIWKNEKDVSFIILGGIEGKRIEHFYANLELAMLDKRITIQDSNTIIRLLNDEETIKQSEYKYISFFPLEEKGRLTLKGFAYDLDDEEIFKGQGLAVSNELKENECFIKVNDGKFLMFLSKNDK